MIRKAGTSLVLVGVALFIAYWAKETYVSSQIPNLLRWGIVCGAVGLIILILKLVHETWQEHNGDKYEDVHK